MNEWINGMGFGPVTPKQQESETDMSNLFFILALFSVLWGIVSSFVIASFLSRHGVKINYVFFRVLMLKYIHQYRKITLQQSGRPGPWFYSFVISMNLALVLAVVGIVLRVI